jgi:hypothetical protein
VSLSFHEYWHRIICMDTEELVRTCYDWQKGDVSVRIAANYVVESGAKSFLYFFNFFKYTWDCAS